MRCVYVMKTGMNVFLVDFYHLLLAVIMILLHIMISLQYSCAAQEKQSVDATAARVDDEVCACYEGMHKYAFLVDFYHLFSAVIMILLHVMMSLQYSCAAQEKQSVDATAARVDDEVCACYEGMHRYAFLVDFLSTFFCRHHDITAMFMCCPGKAVS